MLINTAGRLVSHPRVPPPALAALDERTAAANNGAKNVANNAGKTPAKNAAKNMAGAALPVERE